MLKWRVFFISCLILFLVVSVSGQCVNLTDSSSYASKINNLSGVYYINQNTTLCTQTYNFNGSSGDGVLRFNTSNIVLDCNNSLINGSNISDSYGIYLPFGMENNTIVNCTVGGHYEGLYINGLGNTILNSTLENDFYGIYLDSNSTNTVIQDSRARYNKHGIYSYLGCNNSFRNVSASYNDWYGFQLILSQHNSFIDIKAHNNSQGFIHLFSSINNSFRNVDARENNQSVYFYHNSYNNLFIDSVLNQSTTSDVYVDSSMGDSTIENTFLNVSFTDMKFEGCDGSSDVCRLRVKWYVMVQVDYSNQTPVSGASVNLYNNSDTLIDSGVTGSNGFTRFNLTGFDAFSVSSGVSDGNRNNHSNYTINVFDGAYNHSILVNPVSNSWIQFIFGDCTRYCSNCSDCSDKIKNANPGDVICLDSNITNASTSFCINVSTNNITFSCQGNRVDGADQPAMPLSGIYIQRDIKQETNVTVRDCRVSDWENGDIYLWNVEGVLLQNIIQDVLSGSGDNGIHLNNASFNTLHNISAENNSYGIYLTENSSHNNLVNVRAKFNDWGIYMNNSKGNNLTNATLIINGFDGVYMENSNQSTLVNVLSGYNEWYGIYLESSSENTFHNINLSWNNHGGLFIHESGYNNFTNVTTEYNNLSGVFLLNSSFNNFSEVYFRGNGLYGLLIEQNSTNNIIKDSFSIGNNLSGLYLKVTGVFDPDLNHIFNCFFNNSLNAKIDVDIGPNHFNTSLKPGINIINRSNVSGNYWATPGGDGFSEVCNNTDNNSFCNEPYNFSNGTSIAVDWLPLTLETAIAVDNPPTVSLDYPPDNYVNDSSDPVNISFSCSASDDQSLVNLILYIWNSSGGLYEMEYVTVSSHTWNVSLGNGNYTWNCLAFDNSSQQDWGDSNYTVKVNYSETDLISVSACWFNESSVLQGVSVRVSENITLGLDPLSNCWFDVNGSIHNYAGNDTDTFWFILDTSLMYGNYSLTCHANDTYYYTSSMTGDELEVVTTTTTTTTHTTTTTSGGSGGGGGGGGGSAPPPTSEGSCFDGLLNCHHGSCEEDTDCGGPCQPCPSCSDGIQNQGEQGIDCGGPCQPCPSCSDGIQNQGEQGIDCGGPCRECTREERWSY
ncbi:MAG: hypothetical protein B6U72_05980 [Candidatus Altiarchaeales archaeon ex4484_2]|nr:MAG: hypothetical protein B6U72_05980 [Candidatus Altiarchaeales archaeon ex4484_2]